MRTAPGSRRCELCPGPGARSRITACASVARHVHRMLGARKTPVPIMLLIIVGDKRREPRPKQRTHPPARQLRAGRPSEKVRRRRNCDRVYGDVVLPYGRERSCSAAGGPRRLRNLQDGLTRSAVVGGAVRARRAAVCDPWREACVGRCSRKNDFQRLKKSSCPSRQSAPSPSRRGQSGTRTHLSRRSATRSDWCARLLLIAPVMVNG